MQHHTTRFFVQVAFNLVCRSLLVREQAVRRSNAIRKGFGGCGPLWPGRCPKETEYRTTLACRQAVIATRDVLDWAPDPQAQLRAFRGSEQIEQLGSPKRIVDGGFNREESSQCRSAAIPAQE